MRSLETQSQPSVSARDTDKDQRNALPTAAGLRLVATGSVSIARRRQHAAQFDGHGVLHVHEPGLDRFGVRRVLGHARLDGGVHVRDRALPSPRAVVLRQGLARVPLRQRELVVTVGLQRIPEHVHGRDSKRWIDARRLHAAAEPAAWSSSYRVVNHCELDLFYDSSGPEQ